MPITSPKTTVFGSAASGEGNGWGDDGCYARRREGTATEPANFRPAQYYDHPTDQREDAVNEDSAARPERTGEACG